MSANAGRQAGSIRRLDHAARTIAHQRIGANRAAVIEVEQNLQALADDVVGLATLDVDNKADTARIVFVAWVVKSLLFRRSRQICSSPRARIPPGCLDLCIISPASLPGKTDCWDAARPVQCRSNGL